MVTSFPIVSKIFSYIIIFKIIRKCTFIILLLEIERKNKIAKEIPLENSNMQDLNVSTVLLRLQDFSFN